MNLIPRPLHPGCKVAILSPASVVKREYVDGAAEFLRTEGLVPIVMPSAVSEPDGSYAATYEQRLADLTSAIIDPEVRAIFCARGGYGCVHLLEALDALPISADPKWLIGFSDISALHALWQKHGVVSLHAPMAKDMTETPEIYHTEVMSILRGHMPSYTVPAHAYNRLGEAEGILMGGNLAVIDGLAGTPYDPTNAVDTSEGVILFLEDIGEKIYQVERMLYRLHLSGRLSRLRGLIFGQFTEYTADRNHTDMYSMIDALLRRWQITCPVVFDFPSGHVDHNVPLPLGHRCRLTSTQAAALLEV